jgi:DNA-binding FadR family transcriptional regulator
MADSPDLLPAVRKWLGEARLAPNARLPPERVLAIQFCVSRAELRKVLSVLEGEGLIRRHVGKGTFIMQDLARTPAAEEIAARTSPLAAMQARSVIEPELARLAAINATGAQIRELRQFCARMRQARDWDEYAELDWCFHNVVAEATGNVLLIEIQRLLNDVRRHVVWGALVKRKVVPAADYHSFKQHDHVVDAIEARDGEAAMLAMQSHLTGTRSHMMDQTDRE